MKVQFDGPRLRLRIGRAELGELLDGRTLSARRAWPGSEWRIDVGLADSLDIAATGPAVRVLLPRADVDALAARLPSRDGLRYGLELPTGALDLRFEVDLHDGRSRPR